MDTVLSTPFPSLEDAEAIALQLRERGVPERAISVEDLTPAHGLNLGAGVLPDAVDVVIEQHEHEPMRSGFVVRVETYGDVLNESVAKELFGYVA